MKHSILLTASAAAILVAACGGGGGPAHIQAGQWEMKAKLTQIDAPGAPPQALAPMRAQLNQEQTNRTCITADQAANPLRQFREMMTKHEGFSAEFRTVLGLMVALLDIATSDATAVPYVPTGLVPVGWIKRRDHGPVVK